MDIVEKLRSAAPSEFLMLEAAIEIETLRTEINEIEKIAEGGYAQAWETITRQREEIAKLTKDREDLKKEFESVLLEGYDEAYEVVAKLRKKADAQLSSTNHEMVELMLTLAESDGVYDFCDALGDTIMEKYESLYVTLVNTAKKLKSEDEPITGKIFANSEILSIFETATSGFIPKWFPHDEPGVHQLGTINGRWKLYFDKDLPKDVILLSNEVAGKTPRFATIKVKNFII